MEAEFFGLYKELQKTAEVMVTLETHNTKADFADYHDVLTTILETIPSRLSA